MVIGERLAFLRVLNNMTQKDLSKKLSISVHSISKYERNISRASEETKIEIARLFGVSLDFLSGMSDNPNSQDVLPDLPQEESKTLLITEMYGFGQSLFDKCKDLFYQNNIKLIICPDDGYEASDIIEKHKPDAVLLELVMRGLDAIEVKKNYDRANADPQIYFYASGSFASEFIMRALSELNFRYYMLRPFDLKSLAERLICDIQNKPHEKLAKLKADLRLIENSIERVITEIGIPYHIKGYHYLKEAVTICLQDMSNLNFITKLLYPQIAEKFNTNTASVERAIRHSIEVAWSREDAEVLRRYFGYAAQGSKRRPTNSEFIAMISDRLGIDLSFGE